MPVTKVVALFHYLLAKVFYTRKLICNKPARIVYTINLAIIL